MAPKRIVCIGSGPTILGATFHLNELIKSGQLKHSDIEVVVLERDGVAGGLAGSVIDDKGFAWDLGGHVHGEPSKYDCFRRMLESLPCEWNFIRRAAKADMSPIYDAANQIVDESLDNEEEGRFRNYVPYPVQLSVPLFPPQCRDQCIKDIRSAQQIAYKEKPKDFDEWTDRVFGKELKRVFVTPYNEKVWTVPLAQMNAHWVGERVALVDVDKLEVLSKKTRHELLQDDLGWGPNTFFRYTKKGRGCAATWKLLVEGQPDGWYKYNHEVVKVNLKDKQVTAVNKANGDEELTLSYDYLLSSTPITLLCDMATIPRPKLLLSKVALFGIGVHKPQSPWLTSTTWAYFPDPDIPFYRCTMLSNYNNYMTPDFDKYWSLLLEVGYQPDVEVNMHQCLEKCIKGLIKSRILHSESQVAQRWGVLLPFGYPIPSVQRDSELKTTHQTLESANVYSRGRFGGWKYEVANMDHSFAQGYEVIDRLFNNIPETVYVTGLQ